MSAQRYRKKPVEIEAMQHTARSAMEVYRWIATLEGGHWTNLGDYVIRGVQGEFYPCKPDIFAATYEAVGA